jgi:antitoxin (DNA-binding transcriptional repressor) of toxin-antitoxin stability system
MTLMIPLQFLLRLDTALDVVSNNTMKTANVADLRNDFQKVAAWISDGESVSIRMRGKLFATLTPARGLNEPAMPKIDFATQLKKIWGDKVFSDEEVRKMKAAELEGEEG